LLAGFETIRDHPVVVERQLVEVTGKI